MKMPIKSDQAGRAVLHNANSGPSFGDGGNLFVASNANANSETYCYAGNTYQLPSNTKDPHFLTGSNHFTVSEYNVFLV